MSQIAIADAKNTLTRLIYEAEAGETVHITRRGKPVAVLLSLDKYEQLKSSITKKDFWQVIQEMRADPDFEPIDLSDEEIAGWRDKSLDRDFSWQD